MPTSFDVDALLKKVADGIRAEILDRGISNPVMIGIHTGGVMIAERLHALLELEEPLSTLDISFYRDDFTRIGMNPQVKPSSLPYTLDDRHVILVDDVLYTGRTIRAALNELFDYGRPASVILATLAERRGRELPIHANVIGEELTLQPGEYVKLSGPDPLTLSIQKVDKTAT